MSDVVGEPEPGPRPDERLYLGSPSEAAATIGLDNAELWEAVGHGWLTAWRAGEQDVWRIYHREDQ
jgi:hypothetical protein